MVAFVGLHGNIHQRESYVYILLLYRQKRWLFYEVQATESHQKCVIVLCGFIDV